MKMIQPLVLAAAAGLLALHATSHVEPTSNSPAPGTTPRAPSQAHADGHVAGAACCGHLAAPEVSPLEPTLGPAASPAASVPASADATGPRPAFRDAEHYAEHHAALAGRHLDPDALDELHALVALLEEDYAALSRDEPDLVRAAIEEKLAQGAYTVRVPGEPLHVDPNSDTTHIHHDGNLVTVVELYPGDSLALDELRELQDVQRRHGAAVIHSFLQTR